MSATPLQRSDGRASVRPQGQQVGVQALQDLLRGIAEQLAARTAAAHRSHDDQIGLQARGEEKTGLDADTGLDRPIGSPAALMKPARPAASPRNRLPP